jgi:hypothetical protein
MTDDPIINDLIRKSARFLKIKNNSGFSKGQSGHGSGIIGMVSG